MTLVKRLRLLTAFLGTTAAIAVVGTTVFGDLTKSPSASTAAVRPALADATGGDNFSQSKFANQPALTYKQRGGKTAFAWQVKPVIANRAMLDRDILVMVDTSASQAGAPLKRARQIIDALAKASAPTDRIDVWTVNLDDAKATRSLTDGFKPANAAAVTGAAAQLAETEFAAGATDLKAGLEKAAKAFEANPARQQIILFLGDGESAASTEVLSETARVDLGGKLDQANIAFYAVPLGLKINSHNLHGLASLTGGAVVRLAEDTASDRGKSDFSAKLLASFAVPVLKPTKVEFGAEVAETFPTRLPPLRADRPTLVVGTLKADAPAVTAKVEGVVNGSEVVKVELADRLPVSENDNYFIHAIVEQWREAPAKDAPAILAADRALALGAQQFRLFREEFLSQAVFAINSDKIDHAEKLYQAAAKIDPANLEVEQGLKVIQRLRSGDLTRLKMKAQLSDNLKQSEKTAREKLAILAQAEPPAAGGAAPAPAAGAAGLAQAQAERAVLEQQYRVLVDETIRRSRSLFKTDPDSAYEDLKRQRDTILSNAQISETYRQKLAADLEAMMQTVSTQGAAIKRSIAEDRERIARTKLKINEFERQQAEERQTVARIDSFRELMNQARFELAQQEAQVLIQERISRGQVVPPEATASYMIGQAATNLREYRELVRIREDRYLLTMMQAEKSFIPYPDEPPVHFPPAAVWRELTADREKYKSASIGANVPGTMRRIQSILEGPTAQKIKIENELDGLALKDVIAQLEKDHDLKFVILEDAFKTEQSEAAILDKKFPLKQKFYGLTVGAFLDITLQSIGAYYVVRPEYIEITTYERRFTEKVVRAFDITELVYQIPSSVNQASLIQNQGVQSQNLQLFGQATFAGGFGAIGGIQFGGLGAGGLGGLGGLGGAGGLGGGGAGGFQGGVAGGGIGGGLLGGGAANNLGVGGGLAGFGGGQLGQFGNLGGQFGIQGNDLVNYQLIATLITEVVARGEWADLNGQFQINTPNGQDDEEAAKVVEEKYLNSLAYYPPARALIVRANGKYHPGASVKYKKPEGVGAGGPGNPARGGNAVAAAPKGGLTPDVAEKVGGMLAGADKPGIKNPREDARELMKGIDKNNPTRMWQQALERSNVTDPGVVVACADFLMDVNKPEHVAEVLKTGIRTGLTTDIWAHDALALALREGKASPTEIQRVAMSNVDLEPTEAKGYLKAAQVANENGQPVVAAAYCKKAAGLEPNLPTAYANALVYAGKASEVQADTIHWATANLLGRDWTDDGVNYHDQTKTRLTGLVEKFQKAGLGDQVERFQKLLDQEKKRDLVIELRWQGEADLDLFVTEPSGATASPINKRTVGGGVLKSDVLEQQSNRSEVYTAASAMSGTYKVAAKKSLGRTIGSTVQVVVTKHQGTDKQATEFYTIDLADPKAVVEINLVDGSRTELAVLTTDPVSETRQATTAAPSTVNKGFGGGTSVGNSTVGATKANLPVVVQPLETRLAGVTPNAPSMRAVADVSADRKSVTVTANPVFTGKANDIQLPKVSLLPGAGK